MLNLFTEETYYTKFISLIGNPNLEKILIRQLNLFKDYMKDKNYFINNQHPFVGILNNIIPSKVNEMSKEELTIYLKNNVEYLANVIGCTSNRNKGKYFKDGDVTFIVLLDNNSNVLEKENYDIVEVLYTDYTTIDFSYGSKEEFMVIKLNPIELVLDYLDWEKEKIKDDLPYSYNIYVATKILPKLWDTKLNYVIFNRFMNLYYEISMDKFKNKLPIQIINVENVLDNDLKKLIKFTTNTNRLHISTFMNSYKYLNFKLKDMLSFKDYVFTNNSYWIVWLTRINYIRFFLDLSEETESNVTNNDVIKKLFIYIRRYINRDTILIKLPEEIKDEFQIDFDYIKEKIKYN